MVPVFWGISDTLFVAANDDRACIYDRNSEHVFSFPVPTNRCFSIWTGPTPTEIALALTCDAHDADILTSLTPDRVIATRTLTDITADVRRIGRGSSLELMVLRSGDLSPPVMVAGMKVYIPVNARSGNKTLLKGMAELDLTNLSVIGVNLTQLPGDLGVREPDRIIFPAHLGKSVAALLLSGGLGLPEFHWGVWSTSENAAPALLVEHPFLIAKDAHSISTSTLSDFDPYLVETHALGTDQTIVNFGGDGVFLVDLKRRTADLLYGFGGTPFRTAVSTDGMIAVFVRGGGKLYVFLPRDSSG